MKTSIAVSLCLIILSGCKNDASISFSKKESGTANGSANSAVANGETSILLQSATGTTWKDFTIDLGADFLDTNICSGKVIFGRSGSALCGGSTWTVSTLGLDSTNVGTISGSVYTYSAAANIAHNVINVDMGADYLAGNICSTKSILTLAGTAVCNSVFGDLTTSNMYRNVATAQMTLTTEISTSSYASGYRDVPDVTKDDDGYDSSSPVVKATRPATTCGTSQTTIAARIAHCLAQNPATATMGWSY